ncbi:MAG: helix-turn-helix transcriptional regulator [Haloplanus sp.]
MRIAAPLLALLVLLAGTAPAVALAAGTDTGGSAPSASVPPRTADPAPAVTGPAHARIDAPTLVEINVTPDPGGSARWTISLNYTLPETEDRAAFERYGRSFEAVDADVGLDVSFFRTLASEASAVTGEKMAIRNVARSATVENDTGVVRLSFTWTNFVTPTDEGFAIEDAVLMPGDRTWLASLAANQRLVVQTPGGFQVTNTRFGLENGSVVVDGPHTFQRPLTITYQRTRTSTPDDRRSGIPWLPVGGALLLGVVVVGVLAVYFRGRGGAPATGPASTDDGPDGRGGTVAGDDGDDGPPDEATTESVPDEGDAGEAGGTDLSLLSDEERVERLLERNGGRMKQARIVDETGWSDAKVSQLLSSMADEERVEKLRLGRENLISLPDEES